MKVLCSADMGKSFKETKSAPAFPKEDGRALANIWSLEAGSGKKELWCGVQPASLFRSHDGGDSWDLVPGISNHDHARKWQRGNGGLCLHTIVRDGKRDGHPWRSIARGLPSDFGFPIVVHPHDADTVYFMPLSP